LFQSAEESGRGSKYYLEHNIVTDADACFAMHVMPQLPAGHFALEPGPRMASCTDFGLTIEGASAHGSTPHLGHDAIVAASSAIMNIQTLVSRFNNALLPLVVTVGKIRAGKQFNIICDKVVMEGTIRTFDHDNYVRVPKELEQMVQETAAMYKCKAKMEIMTDEPAAINNHPELLRHCPSIGHGVMGCRGA
jgi:amidohydrolase